MLRLSRGRTMPSRALVYILFAACGGGSDGSHSGPTGPDNPNSPELRVVGGMGITDTIGTLLAQPLTVEIRNSKGVVANATVNFATIQTGPATAPVDVAAPGGSYGSSVTQTTDASGRASVNLRMGKIAGRGGVLIWSSTPNVSASADFTVTPGNAASVTMAPADTAVAIGASVHLRTAVVDRLGNARTDPIAWTSSSPSSTVSASGDVSGQSFGRSTITATSGSLTATSRISSVPLIRLVTAHRGPENNSVSTLEMVDTDGGHRKSLVVIGLQVEYTVQPMGVSGTGLTVYARIQTPAPGTSIHVVDSLGVDRPLLPTGTLGISRSETPAVSADGLWVYFNATTSQCTATTLCLYRAHLDGSGAEIIPFSNGPAMQVFWPTPSPDGSIVAFQSPGDNGHHIGFLNVAQRYFYPAFIVGRQPAWSPSGATLAFISGGQGPLLSTNVDGTDVRTISARVYQDRRISWSPDGKYILAMSGDVYQLVEVATGTAVPLPALGAFVEFGFK